MKLRMIMYAIMELGQQWHFYPQSSDVTVRSRESSLPIWRYQSCQSVALLEPSYTCICISSMSSAEKRSRRQTALHAGGSGCPVIDHVSTTEHYASESSNQQPLIQANYAIVNKSDTVVPVGFSSSDPKPSMGFGSRGGIGVCTRTTPMWES